MTRKLYDDFRLTETESRVISCEPAEGGFSVLCEEQPIHVLCDALPLAQEPPIIGNAAKDHVKRTDLLPRHPQPHFLRQFLALGQRERQKVYLIRDSIVQSAPILQDIVHNPS